MANNTARRKDSELNNREMEIVLATLSGKSQQAIARTLSMNVFTLKHCLTDIFSKLGVQNRLELILFATYHGFVKSNPVKRTPGSGRDAKGQCTAAIESRNDPRQVRLRSLP